MPRLFFVVKHFVVVFFEHYIFCLIRLISRIQAFRYRKGNSAVVLVSHEGQEICSGANERYIFSVRNRICGNALAHEEVRRHICFARAPLS